MSNLPEERGLAKITRGTQWRQIRATHRGIRGSCGKNAGGNPKGPRRQVNVRHSSRTASARGKSNQQPTAEIVFVKPEAPPGVKKGYQYQVLQAAGEV